MRDRTFRKREIFMLILIVYLACLLLFTFFPRPILENGDPTAISEFLKSHANYFYKILYADTRWVAIGNYFMLTPLPIIASGIFPGMRLRYICAAGIALSAIIESSQIFIPGRVSDLADLASNAISVLIGIAAVRFLPLNDHSPKQF
jgi:glycopeptide antibiotics resistance protein